MGSPDPELPDTTLFVTYFSQFPRRYLVFTGINQRPAGWYFGLTGICTIGKAVFSALWGERVKPASTPLWGERVKPASTPLWGERVKPPSTPLHKLFPTTGVQVQSLLTRCIQYSHRDEHENKIQFRKSPSTVLLDLIFVKRL